MTPSYPVENFLFTFSLPFLYSSYNLSASLSLRTVPLYTHDINFVALSCSFSSYCIISLYLSLSLLLCICSFSSSSSSFAIVYSYFCFCSTVFTLSPGWFTFFLPFISSRSRLVVFFSSSPYTVFRTRTRRALFFLLFESAFFLSLLRSFQHLYYLLSTKSSE